MKSIVFDSGPIISLATNSLLDILPKLKNTFKGEFYITPAVYNELIIKPMEGKKYKFEAMRVRALIDKKILSIIENKEIKKIASEIAYLANNLFKAKGRFIQLVHKGEIEAMAASITLKSSAMVVDERTTRLLIEDHSRLEERLRKKLHTEISANYSNLKKLSLLLKEIKPIRSTELVVVAYEIGALDYYLEHSRTSKKELLDAVLWALKLHGCAISEQEIKEIIKIEL